MLLGSLTVFGIPQAGAGEIVEQRPAARIRDVAVTGPMFNPCAAKIAPIVRHRYHWSWNRPSVPGIWGGFAGGSEPFLEVRLRSMAAAGAERAQFDSREEGPMSRELVALFVLLALLGAAVVIWSSAGDASVAANTGAVYQTLEKHGLEENAALRNDLYAATLQLRWPWSVAGWLGMGVCALSAAGLLLAWRGGGKPPMRYE